MDANEGTGSGCSTAGCDAPVYVRGLCRRHYRADWHARTNARSGDLASYQASRKVALGKWVQPPASSPYRLLARTCRKCGALITTPDALLRKGASADLPRCPRCHVRRVTEYQKRRAQRDAEFADKKSRAADEATRRGFARAQRETRESAHHHNHVWTGPEMELAARSDLTAREVADILGRTLAAVNNIRQKIRKDPKAARLAGLSTPLARKATP